MNRSYRSIWNDKTATFVAASEIAKGAGKKSSRGTSDVTAGARFALKWLAVSVMLAFGPNVYALPTGGAVSAGSASIAASAGNMTITQTSQNAAINWQSFNIGAAEAVQFVQPNSNSIALNRVLGSDPSSIFGTLTANGKVFLVNPSGILFGKGSSVNVGGLVASTLNLADADFMAGKYQFSGTGNGTVLNQGTIRADGGYVALLGANVSNEGVISAQLGTVALAAGNAITLDVAGDGLLNVAVDQGAVIALARNGGLIQADGGQVLLTAQSVGHLLLSAVNNTGVIQAQSLQNHNGTIKLMGDAQSGMVTVGGALDVSGASPGQSGGSVLINGHHVGLIDHAIVDASGGAGGGSVLIGGDYQGKNAGIQNSSATYMGADARISADAIVNGNGGKVVVWGNDATRAYGSISARGGARGGAGGLIETSGHYLDVAGIRINAGAAMGNSGTWLLDPNNITINGAGPDTNVSGNPNFTTTNDGAIVQNTTIQTALNAGTSVVITTGTAGTNAQAGDITVASTIIYNAPTAATTLTLNALGDVTVGTAITATTGSFVAIAGGGVNINADTKSTTGDLTFTAGTDINLNAATTVVTGNITANAKNDVKVAQAMTVTTGNIVLHADTDATGPGLSGGTVAVSCAANCLTITTGALDIRFNPVNYGTTTSEIANYATKLTGGGSLDARAWVFAQGNNKTFDGTTAATLSFKGTPTTGGNVVTLVPGTANFATASAGTGKTITYNGYTLGGGDAGKFSLFGVDPRTTTANIDPAAISLSVSATNQTKTYGQTATLSAFTSAGLQGGDTIGSVTLVSAGTPATANVGPYTITASNATGGTFTPSNYSISYVNGTLTVNPASLTVTANNVFKTYGETLPAPTGFTSTGLQNSETVGSITSASTGTPATAIVGSYTITASNATGGTFNPSNYSISYVNGALTVSPASLTVTADNVFKTYGETLPAPTGFTSTGLQNSDTIGSVTETSAGTAAGATRAGGPYAIIPSNATGGSFDPSNYSVSYVNGVLTVNAASLIVSATGTNKVYDGTAAGVVTLTDNRLTGDVLTITNAAANFTNKNVGNGKAVAVTGINVTGTNAANYTFNTTAVTTANIMPKALAVTATGTNKVYDGNTTDVVTLADNRVADDALTVTDAVANFVDKNVGNGKAVNVTGINVTGADAANYTFNTTTATIANITPQTLAVTATGTNKVYDGNTTDVVILTDNRVAGDALTITDAAANFTNKNVGNGKAVNVTGINVTGVDAANYTFNTTTATTANITPKALAVTATGTNKMYDGNTTDVVTLADNRVVGDVLTVTDAAANFVDKNAANGKAVNVAGINVTGADAGNYTFNTTAVTTANITPKALAVTATGTNKMYDGNTTDVVTLADNRVAGDVLTVTDAAANFVDKNVGNGKAVNVTGINVAGADAANYTFNTTTATIANITPKALAVTATGTNKVYDGNTTDVVILADNRVSGDALTVTDAAANFTNKNVGNGKAVNVTGINVTGIDAGNYTFNTTTATIADITAKELIVTAVGVDKVFSGDTTDVVTMTDNRVPGDLLTVTANSSFTTENVGAGKLVEVTGINVTGPDAGNYTYNTTAITFASITPGLPSYVGEVEETPEDDEMTTRTLTDGTLYGGPTGLFFDVIDKGVRMPPVLLVRATPVIVPAAIPAAQPAPAAVPAEATPRLYVAPVHPRKQDRN